MYQWCGFKSRRGKNKSLTALKSNSNTVWFNFQMYIYIYTWCCFTFQTFINQLPSFSSMKCTQKVVSGEGFGRKGKVGEGFVRKGKVGEGFVRKGKVR